MTLRAVLRSVSFSATFAATLLAGCSSKVAPTANIVTVSLASTSGSVAPSVSTAAMQVVVGRSAEDQNAISLLVSGLPAGVTSTITQPYFGTYGSITFVSSVTTAPGVYPITVTASDGSVSSTATYTLTATATDALSISAANASALVMQNGTAVADAFTITRSFGNTNNVTVSASGLPTGLSATFTQPAAGSSGSVSFATTSTPAAAGPYSVTLTASDGNVTSTAVVTVNVGIVGSVQNAVDTTLGHSGQFSEFMSTGFQPSVYNNGYFVSFPSTADLAALHSEHIRLQPVHDTIPWLKNSSPQTSTDWDFSGLEKTAQPVLTVGDQSPMMQIASAPSFLCDSNGNFIVNPANLQLFTQYAQNLVRYYNKGGFDWSGKHFQSASSHPITWWAIFNEPNLNGITPAQYVQIYNALVPAMLSVDPTLKFVAVELSDFTGEPQKILPTFLAPAVSGGVNAQVDALSMHYYGSCDQTKTDAYMFGQVAAFVSDITYFRTQLKSRSDLSNAQLWVTENNINSDFQTTTGTSHCVPSRAFVSDARGTSAFMESWRPYVFSQLGKAGGNSLYHFLFEGSNQYGEVLNTTAGKTLTYWTDYWLARAFPWDGVSSGASILKTTSSEPAPSIEILATLNADHSVSLMVSNLGIANSADNNGKGATRTVQLDISALGKFSSATQIDLNGSTPVDVGPAQNTITAGSILTLNFTGYGTSIFLLKP